MARPWSSTANRGVGRRAIARAISSTASGWSSAKPGPATVAQPSRRNVRNGTPGGGLDRRLAVTLAGGATSSGLGGRVPSSTSRPTEPGQRMASSWAIIPPIDSPTTVGRSRPSQSMTSRASRAMSPIVYGRGACRDHPLPRLSTRTTRWSRSSVGDHRRRPHQTRRRPAVEQHDRRAGPALVVVDRRVGPAPAPDAGLQSPDIGLDADPVLQRRDHRGLRASARTSIAEVAASRRRPRRGDPGQPGPLPAVHVSALRIQSSELAGRRAGQGLDEHHRARHLVAGQVGAHVVLDLSLGQLGPRTDDDERLQALAELLVGHTDDGRLGDRRVRGAAGPRPRPGTRSRRPTRSCRRRDRR